MSFTLHGDVTLRGPCCTLADTNAPIASWSIRNRHTSNCFLYLRDVVPKHLRGSRHILPVDKGQQDRLVGILEPELSMLHIEKGEGCGEMYSRNIASQSRLLGTWPQHLKRISWTALVPLLRSSSSKLAFLTDSYFHTYCKWQPSGQN